jgi:hypothetical protein
VGREVVADDDVIALERWHETLFDIRQEGLSGHEVIKHAWRGHPLRRRPATKVIVCRAGNGRLAAPFVLAAVPSITSRVVSRVPCSRIQRRRARATSARFYSADKALIVPQLNVLAIQKLPRFIDRLCVLTASLSSIAWINSEAVE